MTLTHRGRRHRNLAWDRRRLAEYTLCVAWFETATTQTTRLFCCPKFVHEECRLQCLLHNAGQPCRAALILVGTCCPLPTETHPRTSPTIPFRLYSGDFPLTSRSFTRSCVFFGNNPPYPNLLLNGEPFSNITPITISYFMYNIILDHQLSVTCDDNGVR